MTTPIGKDNKPTTMAIAQCAPSRAITWNAAPPNCTITTCPRIQIRKIPIKNLFANIFVKMLR